MSPTHRLDKDNLTFGWFLLSDFTLELQYYIGLGFRITQFGQSDLIKKKNPLLTMVDNQKMHFTLTTRRASADDDR